MQKQVKIVVNGLESSGSLIRTFRFCQGQSAILSAVDGEDPDVCVTPPTTPGGCAKFEEFTNEPVITWNDFDPSHEYGSPDPDDPRAFNVNTSVPIEEPVPISVSADEPPGDGCRSATGEESSEATAMVVVYGSCSGWEEEDDMAELLSDIEEADYERIPQGTAECRPGSPWGPIVLHEVACSVITVRCTGEAFVYELHEHGADGVTSTAFGQCVYSNGRNAAYRKGHASWCGNPRTAVVAHVVFDPNPCPNNQYKHRLRIRNLVSGEAPVDRYVYCGRYCAGAHGTTCRSICPTTSIRTLLSSRNTMPASVGEGQCHGVLDPAFFPPEELPM